MLEAKPLLPGIDDPGTGITDSGYSHGRQANGSRRYQAGSPGSCRAV